MPFSFRSKRVLLVILRSLPAGFLNSSLAMFTLCSAVRSPSICDSVNQHLTRPFRPAVNNGLAPFRSTFNLRAKGRPAAEHRAKVLTSLTHAPVGDLRCQIYRG